MFFKWKFDYFAGKYCTMSIGNNIKKLRELKNLTQTYMSERLNMSLSGYSKIERDETDISLKRLKQIAEVLDTDYSTILDFDESKIFNITQHQNADGIQNGYTVIKNQQNIESKGLEMLIEHLKDENIFLRKLLEMNSINHP
jgi:transcriptional regulator with XRE-family HTH domain